MAPQYSDQLHSKSFSHKWHLKYHSFEQKLMALPNTICLFHCINFSWNIITYKVAKQGNHVIRNKGYRLRCLSYYDLIELTNTPMTFKLKSGSFIPLGTSHYFCWVLLFINRAFRQHTSCSMTNGTKNCSDSLSYILIHINNYIQTPKSWGGVFGYTMFSTSQITCCQILSSQI